MQMYFFVCVSATKVVSRRDSGHAIGAGFESAIIHSVGKSLKNSHGEESTHRICQVSNNATHFDSFSNSVKHCKVFGEFLHQVKKKLSVFRATGLVSLILRSEGSSFTLTVRPPPSWCPGDRPPPALMVSMLPSGNSSPFCEKSIFTLRSSRRGAELRRLNILEKPIKGFTMLSISKLLVLWLCPLGSASSSSSFSSFLSFSSAFKSTTRFLVTFQFIAGNISWKVFARQGFVHCNLRGVEEEGKRGSSRNACKSEARLPFEYKVV